jgi:tetratricopeptide (TPR) repeat protein
MDVGNTWLVMQPRTSESTSKSGKAPAWGRGGGAGGWACIDSCMTNDHLHFASACRQAASNGAEHCSCCLQILCSHHARRLQHYTTALERDPENTAARGSRCATSLMLKRYADAQSDAEAILKADPSNAKACSRLSKALLGSHDVPGALHWAREAIGHAPSSATLRAEVTRLVRLQDELAASHSAAKRGDAAAALRAAQTAAALARDTPVAAVQVALAEAQLMSGDALAALQTSRDALRSKQSSRALAVHAHALMATGAWAGSRSRHTVDVSSQ